MEYLMTYGWAILIIAIVLVALFSLGVFNSANFAPKAPPGSCQVFRPNGPGTTFDLNLEGECNGELPQYVAEFNGQGFITLPFAWQEYDFYLGPNAAPYNSVAFYGGSTWEYGGTVSLNSWQFICASNDANTVDPHGLNIYLNGVLVESSSGENGQGNTATSVCAWVYPTDLTTYRPVMAHWDGTTESNIGTRNGNNGNGAFQGSIANIQIYNTSISSNDIQTLYTEGIGGAPIDILHIAGWWPLNGNANDYSGNQNNGVATSMVYTTSWSNGYTAP